MLIFASAPPRPVRVARELHRGGVGEELALARYARLDQPPEEYADVADGDQADAEQNHRGTLAVAARGGAREHAPQRGEQQNSAEHAHQVQVEAHVAVKDGAELMPDHAL
jgi:hypothetical protein